MWKKLSTYFLVFLTGINLAALGFWLERKYDTQEEFPVRMEDRTNRRSQFEQERNPAQRWERMLRMRNPNLSEAERRNYIAAKLAYRTLADSLNQNILETRLALLDELAVEQPENDLLDKSLQEIANTQLVLESELVKHLNYLKQFMTPAQQEHMINAIARRLQMEHIRNKQTKARSPVPR